MHNNYGNFAQPLDVLCQWQANCRYDCVLKGHQIMAMQIVDDDVPFILGASFLSDHVCLINYRTQELRISHTATGV